jgi:hypothetical protein
VPTTICTGNGFGGGCEAPYERSRNTQGFRGLGPWVAFTVAISLEKW